MRLSTGLLVVLLCAAAPVHALNLRVGVGTGCTHATLQAALDAIEGVGGDHFIRINGGSHAVPDGMVYQPTVVQGFVRLEGGYASCTAANPGGAANTDAGRSIFDGAGGLGRSVLELQVNSLVGSFQMRRIALQGGDALNSAQRFNHGGGLAVFGNASVLIGAGAVIRNNAAGNGGGVALVGSRTFLNEPLTRADFYIDEDAEIRNNEAANDGGGIYCGGATGISGDPPSEERHGSVVHRQGAINGNRAGQDGSAVYCRGSYAGGGYQPRPRPGALALLSANGGFAASPASGRCVVYGSLDLIVSPNAAGEHVYGADDGSNGLLLVIGNSGHGRAGLCFDYWSQRGGASPPPATAPEMVIQNIWLSGNLVEPDGTSFRHVVALDINLGKHLTLRPSGLNVACGSAGTSCVQFEGNAPAVGMPAEQPVSLVSVAVGSRLAIERARVTGNSAQQALFYATFSPASLLQRASIIDNNSVSGSTGVLYLADDAVTFLQHNTITGNSHSRFFRLDGTATLTSQGNVLHAATAKPLRDGSAPPGNLTLQYCNYLTTLADSGYTGATQVADGFGPLVSVTGALSFGAGFAPPLSLIDQCRTPQVTTPTVSTLIDYPGQPFGLPFAPVNPNRPADLGAVEYRPDSVFANGFE
jgi:predicted outer membrane repeat protein